MTSVSITEWKLTRRFGRATCSSTTRLAGDRGSRASAAATARAGALIAAAAFAGLVKHTMATPAGGALVAAGAALMLHDWHDRSLWFQPGPQNQP